MAIPLAASGSYKFCVFSTPDHFWLGRTDFGSQIWSPRTKFCRLKMVRPDGFFPGPNFSLQSHEIHKQMNQTEKIDLLGISHANGNTRASSKEICNFKALTLRPPIVNFLFPVTRPHCNFRAACIFIIAFDDHVIEILLFPPCC